MVVDGIKRTVLRRRHYARVDVTHTAYRPSSDVMLARTDAQGHTLDDD